MCDMNALPAGMHFVQKLSMPNTDSICLTLTLLCPLSSSLFILARALATLSLGTDSVSYFREMSIPKYCMVSGVGEIVLDALRGIFNPEHNALNV